MSDDRWPNLGRGLLLLPLVLAVGCKQPGDEPRAPLPPPEPSVAPTTSKSAAIAPAASVTAEPVTPPTVQVQSLPAESVAPMDVILAPRSGQVIRHADAAGATIKWRRPPLAADEQLMLKLDAFAPRAVDRAQQRLRLRDLLFEFDQLHPGQHRLVAFVQRAASPEDQVDEVKSPAALVKLQRIRFEIDRAEAAPAAGDGSAPKGSESTPKGPESDAPEHELVVLSPHGTFNGARAADQVQLNFVLLPKSSLGFQQAADSATVSVRLIEPSGAQQSLSLQPGRYALRNLESGDYRIELGLPGAPGRAAHERAETTTITVNRDVDPSKPAP